MMNRATILCMITLALWQRSTNGDGVAFSYNEEHTHGPSNWFLIDMDQNQCSGTKNSPIAITTSDCDKIADYQVKEGACGLYDIDFTINDHVLKGTYKDGCPKNELRIPDVEGTFEAIQFHIHSSSEHTMDGQTFGGELHIVHKQIDGPRYAVVGMMIEADSESNHNMFTQLLTGWRFAAEETDRKCGDCPDRRLEIVPTNNASKGAMSNDRTLLDAAFNIYDMLPQQSTFYHYDGGLTTPPCSEVVWWNVVDQSLSVSVKQYAAMMQLILNYKDETTCKKSTVASPSGSTSRPVQNLNGRRVTRICSVAMDGGDGGGNVVDKNVDSSGASQRVSLSSSSSSRAVVLFTVACLLVGSVLFG